MKFVNNILKFAKTNVPRPFCTAVIAAAGSSTRMGGENKILADLNGVPVLARTLTVFQNADCIHEIVIVTREDSIVPIADICADYGISKATKIVCGGAERIDSVMIGVGEASDEAVLIAVQDGARPLVTEEIIAEAVNEAYKYKAAAPAVPVNDTVKVAHGGTVESTLDRSALYAVQTPQVFDTALIKAALANAKAKGIAVTDDCSAVEALGAAVRLTKGSYENIKLTTVVDYAVAEGIIKRREEN